MIKRKVLFIVVFIALLSIVGVNKAEASPIQAPWLYNPEGGNDVYFREDVAGPNAIPAWWPKGNGVHTKKENNEIYRYQWVQNFIGTKWMPAGKTSWRTVKQLFGVTLYDSIKPPTNFVYHHDFKDLAKKLVRFLHF